MSFTVLGRSGMDIGADKWAFTITGDPTTDAGLKAGIGSIAEQTDSSPPNLIWEKLGPKQTDWVQLVSPQAVSLAQGNRISLEQYGSFAGGVADATLDHTAVLAAFSALATLGGGTLELFQRYAVPAGGITLTGDSYANISVVAKTPGAGFYRTTDNPSNNGTPCFWLQGSGAYTLKNITFEGVTFSGHSTSDYSQLFVLSNTDGVYFNNCRFLNNACEGLALQGQNHSRNTFVTNCYAENVGVGTVKLSAYNMNSDNCLLANSFAINCGQACEQDGRNARIIGNHFENCSTWGILALSTWASWIDAIDGVTIDSSNNVIIANNTFINCLAAMGTGDYTGHVTDGVTVPGNQGRLLITGNTVLKCIRGFTGGADSMTQIVIRGNYFDDAPSGDDYCIIGSKGRFIIENNTFRLGPTSAWAGVVRCGDQDPVNTSAVIQYNTIVGRCFTSQAFLLGPEITLGRNLFENVAVTLSTYYAWAGTAYGTDGDLSHFTLGTDAWLVQSDPDMVFSNTQPSRVRVKGAPPTKGTWKVGDRAENVLSTGVQAWRCVTAGTFDTIKSGVTCSTTSGSASATITAGLTKVTKYQWITIVGVTGAKQLTAYNPTTGAATLSSNADATVTSAAVAYSPGAWQAAGIASVTTPVTTTYAVGASDQIIYYTATGSYSITLPAASASEGLAYTFLKTDTGSGTVTLTPSGTDTINGASTYVPAIIQYTTTTLICTNGAWTYRTNKSAFTDLVGGTAVGSGYILPDLTVTGALTNNNPVAANVNSSTGVDVTWAAGAQEQKFTSTTATPAYNIVGIPSGGFLTMHHYQDATGGRLPTFTTAMTGGIVWAGGSPPTLTATAGKCDILEFHNVGTYVQAWLGPQNI